MGCGGCARTGSVDFLKVLEVEPEVVVLQE